MDFILPGRLPWLTLSKLFVMSRKNGDGHEELYDFEIDPWESENLLPSKQYCKILKIFRASLEKLLKLTPRKG